jgi:hypothetical protein
MSLFLEGQFILYLLREWTYISAYEIVDSIGAIHQLIDLAGEEIDIDPCSCLDIYL